MPSASSARPTKAACCGTDCAKLAGGTQRPKPGATPAEVAQALSSTAVDVRVGRNHPRFNHPAGPGRDLATGFGLINVSAAAQAIER